MAENRQVTASWFPERFGIYDGSIAWVNAAGAVAKKLVTLFEKKLDNLVVTEVLRLGDEVCILDVEQVPDGLGDLDIQHLLDDTGK